MSTPREAGSARASACKRLLSRRGVACSDSAAVWTENKTLKVSDTFKHWGARTVFGLGNQDPEPVDLRPVPGYRSAWQGGVRPPGAGEAPRAAPGSGTAGTA